MCNPNISEISAILEEDKVLYGIMKQCPYELLRRMKVEQYPAGRFRLAQGEAYSSIYLVVEGELDIYVESENGKKYYLNTYRKGNYIGELEMFGPKPYISSVEAITEVTMIVIDRKDFLYWLQTDRNMNDYFIESMCENSYDLCVNMGNNTLYTLKQRICQFLLSGAQNKINIRSESLSERMAVTQRSVNRILQQLKEAGYIEIGRNVITVINYDGLKEEMKIE